MNRREFVGRAAALGGAAALGLGTSLDAEAAGPPHLSARRKIGKTRIVTSFLGMGTGTIGSGHQSNQTRMGHERFNALVRHAYDLGVRFIDCADQYGSHEFIREAIKTLPREKITIQTKTHAQNAAEVHADVERFRQELGVDYIDVVMLHCMGSSAWPKQLASARDGLAEEKARKRIRAHGCSYHSLDAVQAAVNDPWAEVNLVRFNPWGMNMDTPAGQTQESTPGLVKGALEALHSAGQGVIGMKIMAEGAMVRGADKSARVRESVRFAVSSGVLDAMVIGFEAPEQITEVVTEIQAAARDFRVRVA